MISFILVLCIYLKNSGVCTAETVVLVDIQKLELLHEVDERFLSFTIDSKSLARHWLQVGLRCNKVIALTRALRPFYLRIGGTDGDNLFFEANSNATFSTEEEIESQEIKGLVDSQPEKISGLDLIRMAKFAQATEAELIYSLNILQRNGSKWDPANSRKLIRFMNNRGIAVSGWELGNEPDRFKKVFNQSLSGKALARSFNLLKDVISKFPRYSNSLIIGPDVSHITSRSRLSKMLDGFIKNVKNNTLSRLTFHHYYFNGKTATVKDYLDAELMDTLRDKINLVKQKAKPGLDLWIGETSSGYAGGTPNVSDRFVSTFQWLDKLGQSAFNGIQVVLRQTLIAPHYSRPRNPYSLIDQSHHPTPSYFLSYVYKKLIGKKVLNITNALTLTSFVEGYDGRQQIVSTSNKIRLYAHCSATNDNGSGKEVILFGMNLDDIPCKIQIVERSGVKIEEYLFTAPSKQLLSRYCNLNGKKLTAGAGELPLLRPRIRQQSFVIPPKALGFWRLRRLNLSVCN